MTRPGWLAAAAVVCAFALTGRSATAADPLEHQQHREARERFEERQRELERIAPPDTDLEIREPFRPAPADAACLEVARVTVMGSTRLSAAELDGITAPFAGRCLTLADLDRLVDAVNAAYIARGLVTSRAYIPAQDLSDGTLEIVAIEGRVEGFELHGPDPRGELGLAFSGLEGEILDLRDIEQGLEQMNRLPSWDARMRIEPGARAGLSTVAIDAPVGDRLRAHVAANNNGDVATGRAIGRMAVEVDNPLGLLDAWSADVERSFPSDDGRLSRAGSLRLSIPYGYWTFLAGFSHSDYRLPVTGLTETFRLSGRTNRLTIGVNRVLHRGQVSKTSLEAGYGLKRTTSFLEDVRLESGSRGLAVASLRLSHTARIGGGAWYATLGYERGLDGFGTTVDDTDLPADAPHAQYDKFSFDLDGFQPVGLWGADLLWRPSLHAEYSNETLYGSERLTIGGLYSVRGFRDGSLVGDRGLFLRNEIVWRLPESGVAGFDRLFGPIEPYAGLDAGWVRAAAGPSDSDGAIAGAVVGLRGLGGAVFWDAWVAHALVRGPLRDEGAIVGVTVGINL